VIIADDQGWADVGYHGAAIRTPNIDRLAREGVELGRFYVCPVCSPTRAGVMTGRYPNRVGMHGHPTQFTENKGLPPSEFTLADMLECAGYPRRHAIGKWHLGTASDVFHPLRRGFTGFYGHYCGMIDYWTHERGGELDWHAGFESSYDAGYSTHLMTAEAVRFIESCPAHEPFLLYLAYNAVHTPLQAPDEDVAAYDGTELPAEQSPVYAAMGTIMDDGVGQVLAALDHAGVAENTLVWYFSDNGAVGRGGCGHNAPLRGHKGTPYEGGIRVPAAFRWPARVAGGRKVDAVMGYVDLLPTLATAAGFSGPFPNPLDGIDVLPQIAGEAPAPHRAFYPDRGAVVTQQYKLAEDQLFDLAEDPGETRDIASAAPDVLEQMRAHRERFLALTGPAYVPPGMPETKQKPPREWRMPHTSP
jgi:arylsulfatase B